MFATHHLKRREEPIPQKCTLTHLAVPLPASLTFPLSTSPRALSLWGTHHLPFPPVMQFQALFLSHPHLECPTASFPNYHPVNAWLSFRTQVQLCSLQGIAQAPGSLGCPCSVLSWCPVHLSCSPHRLFSDNIDLLPSFPNNLLACWKKCHINLTLYSQCSAHYGEPIKAWHTKSVINKCPFNSEHAY